MLLKNYPWPLHLKSHSLQLEKEGSLRPDLLCVHLPQYHLVRMRRHSEYRAERYLRASHSKPGHSELSRTNIRCFPHMCWCKLRIVVISFWLLKTKKKKTKQKQSLVKTTDKIGKHKCHPCHGLCDFLPKSLGELFFSFG